MFNLNNNSSIKTIINVNDKTLDFKMLNESDLIELIYNRSINLQKLVNRSMDLYNKDENFRNTINNHVGLATTGSKF